MTSPTATRRRSLAYHRNFRQLWVGDAFGQFGAQLTGLVLPIFAVTALDATPWQMGALTAAETAAFLLIGLPAGAWVDRMRKRRTLIVADLVRAVALGVVVVAAATGTASIPLLIAAALVVSAATVFFDVAHQSYVPGLVGLDHVVEGNSKLQATQSVAMVVAPAVGGALLRVISAPALIATTVGTYLVSALWLGRIRHEETLPRREDRRPLRTEIAEGLRFVVHQPLLRRIVACTSIGNLFGSLGGALLVIYALRVVGLDEAALGLVFSLSAAGGLLGAVAAERMARWIGEAKVIPASAVALGITYALNPLAVVLADVVPPAAVLVVAGFGFSFWVVVYNVAQVSFRQRLCPPTLLGRMNASVRFIVWGTMPIGGLLGGWLGTAVGVEGSLWVAAVGMTFAALPVVLSPLRTLTALPRPDDDGAAGSQRS
ncbi:MAG: MFS transporter [Actinotalea sp.]|nr:MFS transporter [Actinotalea sp.]